MAPKLALAHSEGPGLVRPLSSGVEPITERNWLLHASRAYDNPSCASIDEFHKDMTHFKYVRKLLTQYCRGGELKERLILNHIITLGNLLGPELTVRILVLKNEDYLRVLAPFLILLNVLPDVVRGIGEDGRDVRTDEIDLDPAVIGALRRSLRG